MSGAPIDYSVTGPQTAGDPQLAAPSPSVADRLLTASTTTLLLVAPFAGSAGIRGGLLVLAALAACMRLRTHLALLRDHFPRAVLLLFAAWAAWSIASLAWSRDRAYSLGELRPELLYPTLALVFFFIAARADRWRPWWNALMGGTLLVMAASLLHDTLPFALTRHSPDGGPGHLSTHLVLVAPLLFAIAWPRPWGRDHGAATLVAALALLVAAGRYTENRMIWPAFAAQLLVGIAAWRACARDIVASRTIGRVTLAAGIIVVAAFATTVIERGDKTLRLAKPAVVQLERDLRPRIWGIAGQHVGEAPLAGHGFGREILADVFLPVTPPQHPDVRHAHNLFLDVALQTGFVGLALFVALLAALALEYRRYLADPRLAPLGIMALAVLAGFVVKNLTDDFLYRHNALVFWAIQGMLLGLARNPGRRL